MSSYKEIVGQKITKVSSDPGEPKTGQMWYNSTTGSLRGLGVVEAWISSGSLNTARRGGANSSSGTQSASFYAAGGPPQVAVTEEYNGSGWSNGNNTNNSVGSTAGAGTLTSGLLFGGETPGSPGATITEEYDGTNWTSGGALSTGRRALGGCGLSQTAGLGFGGADSTNTILTATEEYNGSSWTAGGALPVAKRSMGACGSQTAGLGFGGYATTIFNTTEEYDGSSWTSGGTLPVAKSISMGSGTQTAALSSGGATPTYPYSPVTNVVGYDGTTWSSKPSIATSRGDGKGSGTNTAALIFGGTTDNGSTFTTATEEFTSSTNTITAAAWAAGATYPVALNQLGGSGTQTAGLCFGGNVNTPNPNGSNQTNEYDGSSWTAGGNLNQSKNTGSRSGVGTQTATMCINFRNDGTSTPVTPIPPADFNYAALTNVEEYDGSSWTAGTATPDGEVEAGTCGTVSAALRFGGNPGNPPAGPATNSTIYWNDSSWTSLNNMSTARYGLAPAFQGTYNAALGFGGQTPPPANVASTEEFDGTNWTAGGNLVSTAFRHSGSGTQTAALSFGGSPSIAQTEGYDGTAWSTRPSLANGRSFGGGAGSSTAALYMCGDTTTHVEEFTGETTAGNITNFTTS